MRCFQNGFCVWRVKSSGFLGHESMSSRKMVLERNEIKKGVPLEKAGVRDEEDGGETATGCWICPSRLFGSFLPSRSKVESSMNDPAAHSGNPCLVCLDICTKQPYGVFEQIFLLLLFFFSLCLLNQVKMYDGFRRISWDSDFASVKLCGSEK